MGSITYDSPCILFMKQTIMVDGLHTSAPTYPTKEFVKLYFGVNDHKLRRFLSNHPEMEYSAKTVK